MAGAGPVIDLSSSPRRRSSRADRLLALAGALACLLALASAVRARQEAARARGALATVEAETERGEARLRALGPSRDGGEAERLASRLASNADAPLPRVLADLASLMPGDVRLQTLQVSYGEDVSVEAQVEARSVAAWDAFLDRLEASSRFRALAPGPEAREGELRVTLRMLYAPAAS